MIGRRSPDGGDAPYLSLVICTLDEAESIGAVLREVGQALEGSSYEVLVVDDSADDGTAAIVRAHSATDPRIRLVHRHGQRGLASAAIAGFEAARGAVLGLMDGDGQHDPHILPRLLAQMHDGTADMAIASRYALCGPTGLAGWRDAISRTGTRLTQTLLGIATTDPLSGFFLLRRAWFEAARPELSGVGFKILVDLISSGSRVPVLVETRAALRPRHGGASKLDLRVIAELAAVLVEKRTRGLMPARFALFAGVGATGVAVHLAALLITIQAGAASFWAAQAAAILVAMTWNFHLNNALTFRDLRLRGMARWRGLASFYLSCAGGALLSEILAGALFSAGAASVPAGLAGTVAAALWNYWSVKRQTWGGTAGAPATMRAEAASLDPSPLP